MDPAGFDVVGEYAEPLPVLVIAELLGVPTDLAPRLRDWSQAIVRMYEVAPSDAVVDAAVAAAEEFADVVRTLARSRAVEPRGDLVSDLVAAQDGDARLTEDEVVASAVLLLNAGHEASVNVFGNGLVAMLRGRGHADARSGADLRRGDAPLRLRPPAVRADRDRAGRRSADVTVEPRPEDRRPARGRPTATRPCSTTADTFRPGPRPQPAPRVRRRRALLRRRAAGPHGARRVARPAAARAPRPADLPSDPESRGTFVLRGYTSVTVGS